MDVMTQDINLFGMKLKQLEAILRSEETRQDKRGTWVDGDLLFRVFSANVIQIILNTFTNTLTRGLAFIGKFD